MDSESTLQEYEIQLEQVNNLQNNSTFRFNQFHYKIG